MSRAWKILLPVAALMVLAGFAAGAVVRAGADEPPARTPIDLGPAPADSTATTPATPATPQGRPTTPSAEVITPRPDLDDDDRHGRDDGDDRDERDDDRRGHDDGDDRRDDDRRDDGHDDDGGRGHDDD
jgi:hypothetical protein